MGRTTGGRWCSAVEKGIAAWTKALVKQVMCKAEKDLEAEKKSRREEKYPCLEEQVSPGRLGKKLTMQGFPTAKCDADGNREMGQMVCGSFSMLDPTSWREHSATEQITKLKALKDSKKPTPGGGQPWQNLGVKNAGEIQTRKETERERERKPTRM